MNNTDRKPQGKLKISVKYFFLAIVVVLLVIVIGAAALFWNELRTLFLFFQDIRPEAA